MRHLHVRELATMREAASVEELWRRVTNDQFFELSQYFQRVSGGELDRRDEDPAVMTEVRRVADALEEAARMINAAVDLDVGDTEDERRALAGELLRLKATAAALHRMTSQLIPHVMLRDLPVAGADDYGLVVAEDVGG